MASAANGVLEVIFRAAHENSSDMYNDAVGVLSLDETIGFLCQVDESGDTPLVVAVRKGHDDVLVHMMIDLRCEWEEADMAQPIAADMSRVVAPLFGGRFSVMESMDVVLSELDNYVVASHATNNWLRIVFSALELSSIRRRDKVVALELLGASAILLGELVLGLDGWRTAMKLRDSPTDDDDGEPPLPKVLPADAARTVSDAARKVFGAAVEVTSMEQLEQLEQWIRGGRLTITDLEVQALLVYRRVASQAAAAAAESTGQAGRPYHFHLKAFVKFGKALQLREQYSRAVYVCQLVLEEVGAFEPSADCPARVVAVFHDAVGPVLACLRKVMLLPSESPEREAMSSTNLLRVIEFCATITKHFSILQLCESQHLFVHDYYYVDFTYEFVMMLDHAFPPPSDRDREQLRDYVTFHVAHLTRDLCDEFSCFDWFCLGTLVRNRCNVQYIRLLLECGADPNAEVDTDKTVLHYLAKIWVFESTNASDAYFGDVFRALLSAGAHLDAADPKGNTFASIVKGRGKRRIHLPIDVADALNAVSPLSCYCARVIRKSRIPFQTALPPPLQRFVRLHGARGV